jgi:hypothetical protein
VRPARAGCTIKSALGARTSRQWQTGSIDIKDISYLQYNRLSAMPSKRYQNAINLKNIASLSIKPDAKLTDAGFKINTLVSCLASKHGYY